jgi:RHS repeat-associated protein
MHDHRPRRVASGNLDPSRLTGARGWPVGVTREADAGAWGYHRDGDLGLDLLHHRWYDPAVGRFLTRDPIRWAGGLNLYGYCGADPVNKVDPSGLISPGDAIGAIGVGMSWGDFIKNPNLATLGAAVLDTVTEVVPVIPGTSVLRHGPKLANFLKKGKKGATAARIVQRVSIKQLKMALGRANIDTSCYNIVQASKKDADALGEDVYGWITRDGEGNLRRDAKGRPTIVLTPTALQDMDKAVYTVGHEIKHIKDALAGIESLSEREANKYAKSFLEMYRRRTRANRR